MIDKNFLNELQKDLSTADHEKLDMYLRMLDRIMLYTIVKNLMPAEMIKDVLSLWERVVKKAIDEDSVKRTLFLETNALGQLSKYKNEYDGEELRLHCLKQFQLAQKIAQNNLKNSLDEPDLGMESTEI